MVVTVVHHTIDMGVDMVVVMGVRMVGTVAVMVVTVVHHMGEDMAVMAVDMVAVMAAVMAVDMVAVDMVAVMEDTAIIMVGTAWVLLKDQKEHFRV